MRVAKRLSVVPMPSRMVTVTLISFQMQMVTTKLADDRCYYRRHALMKGDFIEPAATLDDPMFSLPV